MTTAASMNLLLIEEAEIHRSHVRLVGRRAEHLRRVLRVEEGREVRVGRIGGAIGKARVTSISGEAVELAVEISDQPHRPPAVDVIVALPRPQALKRVLQYSATMGVGRIDFINAWRVEKSFFQTPVLEPAAIRRHLLLGAEQGMSTWVPEVRIERRFAAYVEKLKETPGPLRLLAHPEADDAIEAVSDALAEAPGRHVELAFGPEGGWIDREVESFRQAGFRPVCLGPWILRLETALTAALAQLELLRRGAAGTREAAC